MTLHLDESPLQSAKGMRAFMNEHNLVLLCFSGPDDTDVDEQLQMVESQIQAMTEQVQLKKRLFYIVFETLQNMFHHGERAKENGEPVQNMLAIGKQRNSFYVLTMNLIRNEYVDDMTERLMSINKLSREELRSLYRNTLDDGTRSENGGANLGLIEIARKLKRSLTYRFEPFDERFSYFTLKVYLDVN